MAQAHSGCEVLHQDFLSMQLPEGRFDGIFANASLFHVPSQELPRVLLELYETLKPGGVLFSSNPRGSNEEGWSDGRYACFFDLDTWRDYVTAAGFVELDHYYRPPGLPLNRRIPFETPTGEPAGQFPIGSILVAIGEQGVQGLINAYRNGVGLLLKPLAAARSRGPR